MATHGGGLAADRARELVTAAPQAVDQSYLKSLKRKGRKGTVVAASRKVMFRFDPPIDWHVGEVTEVSKPGKAIPGTKHKAKAGYVKVVYDKDSQHHELLAEEYGVQGKWVVLEPGDALL